VKTIEHQVAFSLCQHDAETWGIALANAMQCLGVVASLAEEAEIVHGLAVGNMVWHRGHVLTGWSR